MLVFKAALGMGRCTGAIRGRRKCRITRNSLFLAESLDFLNLLNCFSDSIALGVKGVPKAANVPGSGPTPLRAHSPPVPSPARPYFISILH